MNRWLRRVLMLTMVMALTGEARAALRIESWDCSGSYIANWTCTKNTGPAFTLVGWLDAPSLTRLTGFDAIVDFGFTRLVPPWYRIGSGMCRPAGVLTVSTGPTSFCLDYFHGMSPRPTVAWSYVIGPGFVPGDPYGSFDGTRARLYISMRADSVAVANATQPTEGDALQLFVLQMNRSASTGSGACEGCEEPVCVELPFVTLYQPGAAGGDRYLYDYGYALLQSGYPLSCLHVIPDATTHPTWGQVKSLYR